MHCSNCGTYLAPGVRFCSGCGSPANDPEATRIVRASRNSLPMDYGDEDEDDDLERVVFTIRPTLIFIKLGYALAVIGAIALVFLLAAIDIPAWISILFGLALLLIPAYYHLKRNMIRYTLTDAKIEIDTGYLFAQAKARDMWQNPLLPPHLLVQALLLGSAVLMLLVGMGVGTAVQSDDLSAVIGFATPSVHIFAWIFAVSSLLHLLMIWGEVSLTHPTAHARLAIWEMMRGRYKSDFWMGVVLSILGALIPWLTILGYTSPSIAVTGAPLALVGMMLYENAYVQAGQSVPLA